MAVITNAFHSIALDHDDATEARRWLLESSQARLFLEILDIEQPLVKQLVNLPPAELVERFKLNGGRPGHPK